MKIIFDMDAETPRVVGDIVTRTGKVFECGDYPDKGFSLTEAEADDAIARFRPASLNIEHMPTALDGKMGFVKRLWRKGKEILAEYSISHHLHELLEGEPVKVSSEWKTDRQGHKMLGACAIVLNPRIRDAVMMSAFSAASTDDEKQSILESLAASFGRSKKEKPTTGHGKAAIQEAHDHAARHGAICKDGDPDMSSDFTMKHEQKGLQAVHDAACMAGAMCPNPNAFYYSTDTIPNPNDPQENSMNEDEKKPSLWEKMRAFFKSEGIDVPDEVADTPIAPTIPEPQTPAVVVTETAEFKAKQDEIDRLTAERDALAAKVQSAEEAKQAQFKADNEKAIDALLSADKIDFAQRETELARRAKNPELYDDFMKDMPAKFAGQPRPTEGTISAEKALRDAEKNLPESAQFNHTVSATRIVTGLSL